MAHKESPQLVKQGLASDLREEIIRGRLAPGQRIVEGHWARKFGVAQTSVREAINLLIAEGFVTKTSGRSARVTSYTEADIAQIYELRAALEGFARPSCHPAPGRAWTVGGGFERDAPQHQERRYPQSY